MPTQRLSYCVEICLGQRESGGTDDQTIEKVVRCLGVNDTDMLFAGDVLQLDEAIMLLERCDWDAVEAEQKSAGQRGSSRQAFVADLKAKRAKIKESKAAGAPKAKAARAPRHIVVPVLLNKEDLKSKIPPGAIIWAATDRGGWRGRMAPRKCISARPEAFDDGEVGAAKWVIAILWEQYAEILGEVTSNLVRSGD